jgi:hypothetical protein
MGIWISGGFGFEAHIHANGYFHGGPGMVRLIYGIWIWIWFCNIHSNSLNCHPYQPATAYSL